MVDPPSLGDDRAARAAVLGLLAMRRVGATICPSEAARILAPEAWAECMPLIHAVVRALKKEGRIAVTQRGAPADPVGIIGPYRIGRPARPARPD